MDKRDACTGYHYDLYDEDEEGLQFNPYTSTYDDGYGDLYFDDVEQEIATCRIGEDGKPKFNGSSYFRLWTSLWLHKGKA